MVSGRNHGLFLSAQSLRDARHNFTTNAIYLREGLCCLFLKESGIFKIRD